MATEEETLLWMLMSVLISYLSVTDQEMPPVRGKSNAETYREAVEFILKDRKVAEFNTDEYLSELISY